jgi:hypothetical protein
MGNVHSATGPRSLTPHFVSWNPDTYALYAASKYILHSSYSSFRYELAILLFGALAKLLHLQPSRYYI